ncbi:MAG TPA: NAD kinase [Crocinitomicaceae bacterium]|nr:NAD kinase [Crocinitomicaceae bacterium]
MNIAVYGKKITTKTDFNDFEEIFQIIREFGWNIVVELSLKNDLAKRNSIYEQLATFNSFTDLTAGFDCALSIGGDGTFIKTVSYVRNSNVPIIGINLGRLGFLANINRNQIVQSFKLLEDKQFTYQERALLCVETENNLFENDNFALNEVTIQRKNTASMIAIDTALNGEFLNTYWADGLIISTPSGSTAYNLSCGGPIIAPNCNVHILTPIAAHNLNVRPMVVPNDLPLKLSVNGRASSHLVSIDGKSKEIKNGEEILVKKAPFTIRTIEFENATFLETIRNKMLWGLDKRN